MPEQWQTIDEFIHTDGWCWIKYDGVIDMAYFCEGEFYYSDVSATDVSDERWDMDLITHVMPIKTPEAPK